MCKAGIWGKRNPALGLGFGFVIFKDLSRLNRKPIAATCSRNQDRRAMPDLKGQEPPTEFPPYRYETVWLLLSILPLARF